MSRKNLLVLLTIIVIFTIALLVVLPIDKGVLGGREIVLGLKLQGGIHLVYQADLSGVPEGEEAAILDGVKEVIANRINPLGVTEPVIERQGQDRIVVELPGLAITDAQKERLGRTALLEFRELVDDTWIPATGTINGQLAPNGQPYTFKIWAQDADLDTFRLKIWYDDNGGEITISDTEEVVLEDSCGDVDGLRDGGLRWPAILPCMFDLVEVHAVEEAEGVLAKMHRATSRIDHSDIAGALETLDVSGFAEALIADLLAGARNQVVGDRHVGASLFG